MDIVAQLKTERDKAARQVNALDTAIRALSGMNSTRVSHGPRKMSAAARARISAAQKARWAKAKGQRLSQSRRASVTSQQQDWRGSEQRTRRDGQNGDGRRRFRADENHAN